MSDSNGHRSQICGGSFDEYSTSSSLLSAARERDPDAWVRLVDRYSRLVYTWCRRRGLDGDESAEVLQTVMLQVSRHLAGFRKDGQTASFRRWLHTITESKISDYRRRARRQPRGEGGSAALERAQNWVAAGTDGSSDEDVARGLRHRFLSLLAIVEAEVEPSTWRAFWLTMIENQSSPEVGAQLGMTDTAVRLAKMRVFRRLRELAAEPDEDEPAPPG